MQKRPRIFTATVYLALIVAGVAGCSKNLPTAVVAGTVTLDGQPVTSGNVLFLPIGGGKQAIGKINADSSFKLTTFSTEDGALIGEHHGVVLKAKTAATNSTFSYESATSNNLTVEPDRANEFSIKLESEGWQTLPGS